MTAAWTPQQLDAIGTAEELRVAPAHPDGGLRAPTTIWVVRVGDELFVRSWRGRNGGWFRAAQRTHSGHIAAAGVQAEVRFVEGGDKNDPVDDAYREKYGRYSGYVEPMVAPDARATTLKLVPAR